MFWPAAMLHSTPLRRLLAMIAKRFGLSAIVVPCSFTSVFQASIFRFCSAALAAAEERARFLRDEERERQRSLLVQLQVFPMTAPHIVCPIIHPLTIDRS